MHGKNQLKFLLGLIIASALTVSNFAAANMALNSSAFDLVNKTLDTFKNSEACVDWDHSEFHVSNFSKLLLQLEVNESLDEDLCQALSSLRAKDLALFADWLRDTPLGQGLSCRIRLVKNHSSWLEAKALRLNARLLKDERFRTSPFKQAGPSIEMDLETSSGPILFHGDLPPKHLALTFDDGPHPSRTQKLLDILERENLQVNFFIVSNNARAYPHLVRKQQDLNHGVGGHSISHSDLSKMNLNQAKHEIFGGLNDILDILGSVFPYFRFPYGARTRSVQNAVVDKGVASFFWNVDTLDWKYKDPEFLYDYALTQIRNQNRGIVLFHDVQEQTITIMPQIIRTLKAEDFKFVVFKSPQIQQSIDY